MKRYILIATLFVFTCLSSISQEFNLGLKGGFSLCSHKLSNGYVFYTTEGNHLAFHVSAFIRKNLSKYFLQAEPGFQTGMKALINYRGNQHELSKSSINIPLIFGRAFYPGNIRVYAGLSPGFFIGNDDLGDYLVSNRLIRTGNYGSSPGLSLLAGSGVDLSKLTIDIRYESNLLGGFFYEEKNPNIRTYHSFSHIFLSLGFKIL